jgi:hypothetical protein
VGPAGEAAHMGCTNGPQPRPVCTLAAIWLRRPRDSYRAARDPAGRRRSVGAGPRPNESRRLAQRVPQVLALGVRGSSARAPAREIRETRSRRPRAGRVQGWNSEISGARRTCGAASLGWRASSEGERTGPPSLDVWVHSAGADARGCSAGVGPAFELCETGLRHDRDARNCSTRASRWAGARNTPCALGASSRVAPDGLRRRVRTPGPHHSAQGSGATAGARDERSMRFSARSGGSR